MLCNMYLFNAGLNKYEYVKCCIIVANTYGHGVIRVVVVIVYCWGDAAFLRNATPPLPIWCHSACVGVLGLLCVYPVPHHAPAVIGRACADQLPVAWRLYVGVARPLPAFQKQATVCQGRQRLILLSALWVTATCHAYTTLSKLCL